MVTPDPGYLQKLQLGLHCLVETVTKEPELWQTLYTEMTSLMLFIISCPKFFILLFQLCVDGTSHVLNIFLCIDRF